MTSVPGIDSSTMMDQGGLAFYTHCNSAGDYCPGDAISVQDCTAGYYCPSTSSRVPCATGLYSSLNRQTIADVCKPCPPNTYAGSVGAPLCMNCSAGTYSCDTRTACCACHAGFWCTPGFAPQACPAGTFRGTNGASTLSQCEVCPPGQISPKGSTSCSVCLEGSYANSNQTLCMDCEAGGYCTNGRRFLCPNGTASAAIKRNTNFCQTCPDGGIANSTGTDVCIPCAASTYASIDADRCYDCEQGAYCRGGTKNPCPAGTSSSATKQLYPVVF
jgi:hypothetical protein